MNRTCSIITIVLTLLAPLYLEALVSSVTFLGSFSNMQFTEEHAYGSTIELWQEGSEIFGLFMNSQGLAGDAPTGLLQAVRHDPKTGEITFKAKLTMGSHYCEVHKEAPSQDVFTFKGVLKGNKITGTLSAKNDLHPEAPPKREKVVLKRLLEDNPAEVFKIRTRSDMRI